MCIIFQHFLSQLSDKFSWTEDKVPHGQDFYKAYMSCCDSIEQSDEKGTLCDNDRVDTTRIQPLKSAKSYNLAFGFLTSQQSFQQVFLSQA
jgi:hypothetical protein